MLKKNFQDTFINLIEFIGKINSAELLNFINKLDFMTVLRLSNYKDHKKLYVYSQFSEFDIQSFMCRTETRIFTNIHSCIESLINNVRECDLEYIELKDFKIYVLDMETFKIKEVELD